MEFFTLVISIINVYTNYRFEYYLFNKLVNVKVISDKNNFNINNFNNSNNLKNHAHLLKLNLDAKLDLQLPKSYNTTYPNNLNYFEKKHENKENSLNMINSPKINDDVKIFDKTSINKENCNQNKLNANDSEIESYSSKRFINNNDNNENLNKLREKEFIPLNEIIIENNDNRKKKNDEIHL